MALVHKSAGWTMNKGDLHSGHMSIIFCGTNCNTCSNPSNDITYDACSSSSSSSSSTLWSPSSSFCCAAAA